MHVDTRLTRGDRIRIVSPDEPPQPIWELVCDARPADDCYPNLDPQLRGTGQWSLHIRWVTPGISDNSAVGDEDKMMVRMDEVEFISRAAEPGKACEWGCW